MSDLGSALAGDITYSCDLFSEQTVQRMAGHYAVSTPVLPSGGLVHEHCFWYLMGW